MAATSGLPALSEYLDLVRGVSYTSAGFTGDGPLLVGLGSVVPGGGLDLEKARPYSGGYKEAHVASAGDLILALTDLTQEGSVVGSPSRVPDGVDPVVVTLDVARVVNRRPRELDNGYLYYLLQSRAWRTYVRGLATGTTIRRVRPADALSYAVAIPPIEAQRSIAGTLSALDEKIELNRRMADTLDEIAQTLFRLWFVEPAGRAWPSGGEGLPEGWTVERLGEHVDAVRGLSYTSAGLGEPGEGLPMSNLNTVLEGGGFKRSGLKWFTGPHKERSTVSPGDLVVTNVEQGFEFLLIGYGALIPRFLGDTSLFSADLFRVRPRAGSGLTSVYLYLLLRDPRFHRTVAGFSNGTTVNHLSSDGLSVPRIVVPPRELVAEFDSVVHPMLERRDELESESDTLREIRDALLPPLLDGRIEVPPVSDREV